jgi:hypothetical protein
VETIHTDVEIAASPEKVWAVLSDFESYPEWNPYITSIKGEPKAGTKLEVTLQAKGKKPRTFKPEVTQAEPGRVFEWLGHLGVKGIFDGRHHFELEATDNGTHFVQREEFSGILVLPILKMVRESTEGGFHLMNRALKERAEAS